MNEKKMRYIIASFAPKGINYYIFGNSVQYIFPNINKISSNENFLFLSNIIRKNNIDIILHPYTMNDELTEFCVSIKKTENVRLVSAIHFSITYKDDLIRHSLFNEYRLGNNIKNGQ